MPSTKFVFFGPIRKTRWPPWPPWPLIRWDIFDFSSETAEPNSTKLDRKQDLNTLYQVRVFRADRKNKMAALASDWLRHLWLLLWNRWREFNETWQEARSQSPQPSLCFSGRSEKQDGHLGLWLAETFSTSPLKPLNRIQQNLIGSKISKPSTKFVFFGPIGKTRWPPRPLIGWDIFDFSVETTEWNSTNLDRKQDLNALYQVCVFWANRKNKMTAWPLIGWDIFDFFSETAEWNSTKLDWNQDLNALYQYCVFRANRKKRWPPWPLIGRDIFDFSSETAEMNSMKLDRKQDLKALYQVCVFWAYRKNKMAALASDWLRHFRFLLKLLNIFSETWQGASSQCLLPRLCFSGKSGKNKMAALASDWPRHFRLLFWNCERNSTKLDRKQDLNALYLVCVFQVDRKNKMAALAYDLLRQYQLFLWNCWIEFNKTWQEARSQHPIPGLRFSGWSEKQDSRPVLWLAETFLTSPMKPLNGIQQNLTESKFSTSSSKLVFFGADPKNNMAALASDWLRHILTFPLKPLKGIQRNLTGSKILTSSTKFVFFGPKSE